MKLFTATPEQPPPRPLHWLYYLLYTLGLVAGLWQHGHPYLTLTLICATPVFGMSAYVPRRWLGPGLRSACQHLLGVAALLWMVYRVQMKTPMDLMLVEAFSIMGAGFAFSTVGKSYGFVMLMSTMLFGYGALLPIRLMFLMALPPAAVTMFVLMYNTRIPGLAQSHDLEFRHSVSRRNLKPILGHALLASLAVPLIASLFPQRGGDTYPGAARVSFEIENQTDIAPALDNWFRTPNTRRSATASHLEDGYDPTESAPDAKNLVPDLPGPPTMSQNGQGSGLPSDRLVMRVKSPVKLYWLAQLYDSYDGVTWSQSRGFERNMSYRHLARDTRMVVPQTFWIESWVSPTLYSAFQQEAPITPQPASRIATDSTWYGERLRSGQPYPALPFRYSVRSSIANPDAGTPMVDRHGNPVGELRWPERMPRERYLILPKSVTDRVRQKSLEITRGLTDPKAKAFALRDYLRDNFDYTLAPGPPPEGREAVDYLLFDLKAAHCQYFAAALAVMGRVNGLPTRVATGFSPGDYNTVTGLFEVREYHAHAWTQVYLDDIGWVTMDGTPASADQLQLRNTPAVVGNFMRDPFSPDWRITSPELSQDVVDYKESFMEVTGQSGESDAAAEDLPDDALTDFDPSDESATNRRPSASALDPAILDTSVFGMITRNFTAFLENVKRRVLALVTFFSPGQLLSLMVICVSLMVLLARLPQIVAHWRLRRRLDRLNLWYAMAQSNDERDPAQAVLYCYRSLRELLTLAGMPRNPAQDLYAYGTYLREIDTSVGADAVAVFTAYSRLRYSREPVAPADARAALDHTEKLREHLLPAIVSKQKL